MDKQTPLGKSFGEYLDKALGYATDCAKWGRYISVGQAFVELGYATKDEIDVYLGCRPRTGQRRASGRHRGKASLVH